MVMLPPFEFGVVIMRMVAVLWHGLKMEDVENFILIVSQDDGQSIVKESPKDTDAILIYNHALYWW
jgi:hypothetical protein